MNLGEQRKELLKELTTLYDKNEAGSLANQVMEFVFGMGGIEVSLNRDRVISVKEKEKIKGILTELKSHKPIQYITGITEFYDCRIKCETGALIPRPETEELVDWIVKSCNNIRPSIMDIGTGTGCIPIALAKHIPGSSLTAIDISPGALELAKNNAKENRVEVKFIMQDILTGNKVGSSFPSSALDLIVSNPPYVRDSEKVLMQANVLNWEPHTALFVSDIDPLLFYREITKLSADLLRPGGWLYFEINEAFHNEIDSLLKKYGFREIEIKKDLQGKFRMARGQKPGQL